MKKLLAGLAVLSMATSAHADWKFTKWNMKLSDVLKASDGKAYEVKGRKGQRVGKLRVMATMPITQNGVPLIAELYFDSPAKRLRMVRYKTAADMSCPDQRAVFKQLFGPGLDSQHDLKFEANAKRVPVTVDTTDWHGDNSDLMSFSSVSVGAQAGLECTLVIKAPQ